MGQTALRISGLSFACAQELASILIDLIEPAPDASSAFEDVTDWSVEAYYAKQDEAETAWSRLLTFRPEIRQDGQLRPVPDRNWVAISQAALPPVVAGRFKIIGSHDVDRIARGPGRIIIDAGEAFGTAHHATTFGCLLAIDCLTRQQVFHNVLDLGTGSGVLALAVRRVLNKARILASDYDAQAVRVAQLNGAVNGMRYLSRGPRFVAGSGLEVPAVRRSTPFDLVIANILAAPLVRLAPAISRATVTNGYVVLSGILIAQAPEVIARYRSLGMAVRRHDRHNGWSTLTLTKR